MLINRLPNRIMRKTLQSSILFSSLAAMLLLEVINSEATVISSSSSSSGFGSSCDGLQCPANTNCISKSSRDNLKSTTDKRCTTHDGVIIKHEITTSEEGKTCTKNLSRDGRYEENCNHTNDQKKKTKTYKGRYNAPTVDHSFEQQQEIKEDILGRDEYMKTLNENLEKLEKKKQALEKSLRYRQQQLELRKQQLEEQFKERKAASWDKYFENIENDAEAMDEQLERQQEAKILQMERAAQMLERQQELRELQMERALEAMELKEDGRRNKK